MRISIYTWIISLGWNNIMVFSSFSSRILNLIEYFVKIFPLTQIKTESIIRIT